MTRRRLKARPIQRGEPRQPSGAPFGGIIKSMPTALNVVVLILTIIASTYGALYLVFPHLQPRAKLGAKIDRLAVQQDITFGHWRALQAGTIIPPPPLPEDPPYSTPGLLTLVHVQLSGFQSSLYSAEVKILDAKTHREIITEELSQSGGICGNIKPEADDQAFALRCWSPRPRSPSKYLLRIELYDAGPAKLYEKSYAPVTDTKLLDFQESEEYTSTNQLPTVYSGKSSP